jgi:hypothetical protein
MGYSTESQRGLRGGHGRRAGRLQTPARSGSSARVSGRSEPAIDARHANCVAYEARPRQADRLRISTQRNGQSLHVLCAARRLAARQSDGSPHRDRRAHDADRKYLTPILDRAEFHPAASEKMRRVFFRISRSMRRRSFSRRNRAFSVAKSVPACGIAACVLERRGDPACPPSSLIRQPRSGNPQLPGNLP